MEKETRIKYCPIKNSDVEAYVEYSFEPFLNSNYINEKKFNFRGKYCENITCKKLYDLTCPIIVEILEDIKKRGY